MEYFNGHPRSAGTTTTEGAISSNDGAIASTEGALSSSEGAISSTEGAISSTEGAVSSSEGAISSSEGALSSSEGAISSIEGAISSSEGALSSSEGALSSSEGAISSTEGSMSSTEGAISSSEGTISSAGSNALDNGVTLSSDGEVAGKINGDLVQQASVVVESPPGLQKKGLRVSFPEFEVVSGYMDPPRPWNDVSQCSTDELIASYLNACNKVGVKPNARLLSQLQVITNFDERNETLTLKNEHLDVRHCETLEEVFRRVQFRTVDLEATKLEEEGAVTIFDMIEYYESCLKLNISYSKNLGQRGWQACSRMIRKTPCLENLEARGAVLSDFVMPILGRSLRVSSSLTSLHLEFTVTSGKPLQVLVAALKVNETLKELYLADNKLMPSDGIQLGSLLRYNRTLHLLDLRNNHLQDTGFLHLSDGIWEQGNGSGLNTLVVWNNQLSYQAMNHLSKALLNSASLETINLGHNNLTNEGMHRLKESLLKSKMLLRIGLQAAKITCEGAVALAEFIAESVKLVRLDLRENEIKTGGLMALSLALKVSQSVTRIDLDKDPKKESGVKDYAEQQKRLLNDITTYTQRNRTLARQREEEETAKESQRASVATPNEQPESVPDEGGNGEAETATGNGSNCAEVRTPEDVAVAVDIQKRAGFSGGESSPRHRMNLTLELKTRCEMLESPDFVSELEMPPADLPTADAPALASPGARPTRRRVILDIPPSPMVSSQGKPVLVPVLAGSMSPSFDEETSPSDGAELEDFEIDSPFHLSPRNQSFSEVAESTSSPDESPGFWDESISPLSSLGSNSSIEDVNSVPSTANSFPSHRDNSLAKAPNKKSSLKMTRPKHRFLVSKASLSHKPPGRRGFGGSHRILHATTEHSRSDGTAAPPPPSVTSLTAFQSAAVAIDSRDNGVMNSGNSKVTSDDVSLHGTISGSVGEKETSEQSLNNFTSVENQNVLEVDGLLKNSIDVALHAPFFPTPGGVSENANFHGGEEDGTSSYSSDVENPSEAAKFDLESALNLEEIPSFPRSFNDQVIITGAVSNDIIPESKYTSADNSGVAKSFQIEDQTNGAGNAEDDPRAAPDNGVSTAQAPVDGKAEGVEKRKGNYLTGKSLHISNGLVVDFPANATGLGNFGDDVHAFHVETAPSDSSDDVV